MIVNNHSITRYPVRVAEKKQIMSGNISIVDKLSMLIISTKPAPNKAGIAIKKENLAA